MDALARTIQDGREREGINERWIVETINVDDIKNLIDHDFVSDKVDSIKHEVNELLHERIKHVYGPHVSNNGEMIIVLEAAEAQCKAAIDALECAKDLCSVLSNELGMQLAQERKRRETEEE